MSIQRTKFVRATLTLDLAAYAAGDIMGPVVEFDPGGPGSGGLIQSIQVIDQAKLNLALTVDFWDSAPTGTLTDNAAPDITDASLAANSLGHKAVATTDYLSYSNNSKATVGNVTLPFVKASDGKFRAIVIAGGAYDAVAATDLVLVLGLLLD